MVLATVIAVEMAFGLVQDGRGQVPDGGDAGINALVEQAKILGGRDFREPVEADHGPVPGGVYQVHGLVAVKLIVDFLDLS